MDLVYLMCGHESSFPVADFPLKKFFMLLFLDYFLLVFHVALTAFNAFGWAFERTRLLHLIVIWSTLASWTVLAPFYGWGYCPFTDWHWQVKRALGESPLPGSFVKYCFDQWTGWNSDPTIVTNATAVVGVLALVLSCVVNWRAWRRGQLLPRKDAPPPSFDTGKFVRD